MSVPAQDHITEPAVLDANSTDEVGIESPACAVSAAAAIDGATAASNGIYVRRTPIWKRALDLAGVFILLPLLFPLLLVVGLYIKLVSRGPVFFVQSRLGLGGEYFSIYKFRTMRTVAVSRDAAHRDYVAQMAGEDSPAVKPNLRGSLIPGGRLLRATSIDELPQIFNVWLGNMSLVGPRPDLLHREDYQTWQLRRFEVLPGMTGLWQVSGKNRLTYEQMIQMDIQYIENMSLRNDLAILMKTVRVLLLERNE